MYRWIRNTHLLTGLFSFSFILMFGISSIKFIARNPAALARELISRHGLRDDMRGLGQITRTEIRCQISRPGTAYQVRYSPEAGVATVIERDEGLIGMMASIHAIHGLKYQYPILNVWALVLGLVSFGLIFLALSGIYLWFKLHKERVVGAVLLVGGLGYSLSLVYALFVA